MAYFQELPNIAYPSLLPTKNKVEQRIIVKNIFRRAQTRPDLDKFITSFEAYELSGRDTPSRVAAAFLGSLELDWVILLTNNIIDFYDQWPKQ